MDYTAYLPIAAYIERGGHINKKRKTMGVREHPIRHSVPITDVDRLFVPEARTDSVGPCA